RHPAMYSDIELSKDGTHATVSVVDSSRRSSDIWIYDVVRGVRTKFTFDAGEEQAAVWSSDGKSIMYSSSRTPPSIYRQRSDASGGEEQIPASGGILIYPASVSPDGRLL